MNFRIHAVLLTSLVALPFALRAEVQWHQPILRLEPAVGARDVAGAFEFTNTGKTPVRLVDVRSGCGCTVAALETDVVQPGEKGRVQAVFHIGDRVGKQHVAVTVRTEEPEPRTYDLAIETDIRPFVVLTPKLLFWRVGEATTPKVLQLTLAEGFRYAGAESASPDFHVEFVSQSKDRVQLRVTPRDTWAKRQAEIHVSVAQGEQAPAKATASVRVL